MDETVELWCDWRWDEHAVAAAEDADVSHIDRLLALVEADSPLEP